MRAGSTIYFLLFLVLTGSSPSASPSLFTAHTLHYTIQAPRRINAVPQVVKQPAASTSWAYYNSIERKHYKSFHKKCLVVKEFVLFTFAARPPICAFISRKYGYLSSVLQGQDIVFSPLRGPPAIG